MTWSTVAGPRCGRTSQEQMMHERLKCEQTEGCCRRKGFVHCGIKQALLVKILGLKNKACCLNMLCCANRRLVNAKRLLCRMQNEREKPFEKCKGLRCSLLKPMKTRTMQIVGSKRGLRCTKSGCPETSRECANHCCQTQESIVCASIGRIAKPNGFQDSCAGGKPAACERLAVLCRPCMQLLTMELWRGDSHQNRYLPLAENCKSAAHKSTPRFAS